MLKIKVLMALVAFFGLFLIINPYSAKAEIIEFDISGGTDMILIKPFLEGNTLYAEDGLILQQAIISYIYPGSLIYVDFTFDSIGFTYYSGQFNLNDIRGFYIETSSSNSEIIYYDLNYSYKGSENIPYSESHTIYLNYVVTDDSEYTSGYNQGYAVGYNQGKEQYGIFYNNSWMTAQWYDLNVSKDYYLDIGFDNGYDEGYFVGDNHGYFRGFDEAKEQYGIWYINQWLTAEDYGAVERDKGYNIGYADGEVGDLKLTIKDFLPGILGAIFMFFYQLASISFLGISLLQLFGILMSLAGIFLVIKFFIK